MNKTFRKQLAIATSVQLVNTRKKRGSLGQDDLASRAGRQVGAAQAASGERHVGQREPLRHAGINE
jgi:hypothetical protein